MKCANCGADIPEGRMYCEQCGYEVHIVPEFQPDVEAHMEDAIESITGSVAESQAEAEDRDVFAPGEKGVLSYAERQMLFLKLLVIGIIVVVTFLSIVIFSYTQNPERLMDKAKAAYDKGNYQKAVTMALDYLDKDRLDTEALVFLGNCYLVMEQKDNAFTAYMEAAQIDDDYEPAIRAIAALYESDGDYESINSFLIQYASDRLKKIFSEYIAEKPSFSMDQGTYDEPISVKLLSNSTGVIYYTTDGSLPDEKSEVYKNPIELEKGVYTIRCIYINKHGIKSEEAISNYQITRNPGDELTVSLESGAYDKPQTITVEAPSFYRVFYTVDGSTPGVHSIPCNGPISLPLGATRYKFIAIGPDGSESETVERDYTFTFTAPVAARDAVNMLITGLADRGIIAGYDGSLFDRPGRNIYMCSTAIAINGVDYYLVVEYYEDAAGGRSKTGNMYCIDASNGSLYRAGIGPEGYSVVSL